MKCPKGQIWDAQLKGCRNITMADLTNQPKQTSGVNFPNPRNNVPVGTVFPNQSSGTNFPNYKPKTLTKEQQEAIDKANQYKKGGIAKTAAWTRKEGKDPKGGLNAKGVASYRAANPGSKLQTAVTTKPSKLKAGSKDAKRRKSFCARMSGMPGPAKKPNGEPSRKTLALRKWNC